MFIESILIAGYGGQGILFGGKVLAQAALHASLSASFFPSYGAEIRGGTANCTVRVSDASIGSPLVTGWNNLLILNQPSLERFSPKCISGGLCVINSSIIHTSVAIEGSTVIAAPLSDLSKTHFGDAKFANTIGLGIMLTKKDIIPFKYLEQAIATVLKKKDALAKKNLQALQVGAQYHAQ